jgi:hypothetical protein
MPSAVLLRPVLYEGPRIRKGSIRQLQNRMIARGRACKSLAADHWHPHRDKRGRPRRTPARLFIIAHKQTKIKAATVTRTVGTKKKPDSLTNQNLASEEEGDERQK